MPSAIDAFNFSKQFIVATGTFALLLVVLFYEKDAFLGSLRGLLERIICSFIAVMILLSIPNGIGNLNTLWGGFGRANGLFSKIPMLILVLIIAAFVSSKQINRFFWLCLVLLSIEVFYGFIQLMGKDPFPWNNPYKNIFLTTGNPNFAAAMMAILVVASAGLFSQRISNATIIILVLLLLFGIFISYKTYSIQGVLTIAAGTFLLVLIGILRSGQRRIIKLWILSTLLGLGALITAGVFNFGPLKSFIYQETLSVRLHYWRVAVRIIRDHPWFGVGIDRYGDYFRIYREESFVRKYSSGLVSNNAHNVALQWGSDFGILGVIMYSLVGILGIVAFLKCAKLAPSKRLTDFDFLFVAFFAFYLQSIISIAQISVTILGFALLGILLGKLRLLREKQQFESIKSKRRATKEYVGLGTSWIVIALLMLPLTSWEVRKDLNLRRALEMPSRQQNDAEPNPKSEAIKSAVLPLLTDQDYLAFAVKSLYSQGSMNTGFEISKKATDLNSNSWVGYQAQVQKLATSGEYTLAMSTLQKVIELDPLNYELKFNMADLNRAAGNRLMAESIARQVIATAPSESEAYKRSQALLQSLGVK